MLTVSHISKTFNPGTVNEKCAIRDLSLHLDPGDFVTIIGANGAGKSTLFNAIAGSFYTDSGSIVLDGRDITFLPEYKRAKIIGRLFQDPMLGSAPGMTIEENLALAAGAGGWLSHVTRAEKDAFRERLALLDMGLENRMKQPVGLLSGGQRQALTLMMATMADPKLLLLDEPAAGMNPHETEELMENIAKIRNQFKIAILLIEHDMSLVMGVCEGICVLNFGKVIAKGTADEIQANPAVIEAYLGKKKEG